MNRRVADMSEVAAALGVHRTTAWRWCKEGRLPVTVLRSSDLRTYLPPTTSCRHIRREPFASDCPMRRPVLGETTMYVRMSVIVPGSAWSM